MSNKFDVLLKDWRSFFINEDTGEIEKNGDFYIEEVHDDGLIEGTFTDDDGEEEVYGQAIVAGPLINVGMEHLAVGSTSQMKRYVVSLVVDDPNRQILIGKRASYDIDELRDAKKKGERARKAKVAAAGQEDGTVIITKP